MLQQLGRALSSGDGGPVNWSLAQDTARQVVAAEGDRSVAEAERRGVDDAARLAEVWLDPTTTLPAATTSALAWSRSEWVEGTLPTWAKIVEPGRGARCPPPAATRCPRRCGRWPARCWACSSSWAAPCSAPRSARAWASSRRGRRPAPTSGCRSHPRASPCCCRPTSRRSARGWRSRRTTCACTSRCARRPTIASIGHVAWLEARLLGAVEEYAGGINVDRSTARGAVRRPRPPRPRLPSSRPSSRGSSSPRTRPRRPRPWPGWRRCSPWSRAGSTRW